mmetsp:Transcript_17878/g.32320  ORF Transcript_17878/g.32320 Transcript_17878/m.32320 type:complete len:311 (-) Transcript_17878:262-1194(-)
MQSSLDTLPCNPFSTFIITRTSFSLVTRTRTFVGVFVCVIYVTLVRSSSICSPNRKTMTYSNGQSRLAFTTLLLERRLRCLRSSSTLFTTCSALVMIWSYWVQNNLDTNDSDKVEEMLLREWDIFCRKKAFRETISDDVSVPYAVPVEPPSTVISLQADVVTDDKASVGYSDGDFPDVLLTAVACLVDQQELSEDAAAAILASWSDGGNQLLRDIYDHFIEFGGVDDFLDMLKVVADEDYTSRMVATAAVNVNKSAEDAFRNVLKNMRAFGQVEIAALRLASVRKDPHLAIKQTLLGVVDRVMQETDCNL